VWSSEVESRLVTLLRGVLGPLRWGEGKESNRDWDFVGTRKVLFSNRACVTRDLSSDIHT